MTTEALRQLDQDLRTIECDDPGAVPTIVNRLSEIWSAAVVGYRFCANEDGWSLDFASFAGFPHADPRSVADDMVRRVPRRLFEYNALRPEAWARNRIVGEEYFSRIEEGDRGHSFSAFDVPVGVARWNRLRLLVCRGPLLVACISVYRPAPFSRTDRADFQSLIPRLRKRLSLEARLRAPSPPSRGLVSAVGALDHAAFVIREDGAIEYANTMGVRLFDRNASAVRTRLQRARRDPASVPDVTLTAVRDRGASVRFLAIVRGTQEELDHRVAAASARWRLSPRQSDVLRRILLGDCNKDIMAVLGIEAGTVEAHVTAILRKTGSDSRARLISNVLFGPDLL